jgi:hypothetical protein
MSNGAKKWTVIVAGLTLGLVVVVAMFAAFCYWLLNTFPIGIFRN